MFFFRFFFFSFSQAVLLRQNLLSGIYLILLLLAPILPSPTPENVINGINGIYLKSIIVLSSIANSAHIITQIILLAAFNYSTSIDYCTNIGKIMNLIGLHRYNDLSFFNIIRLCCMDFIVLLITCLVLAFSSHTYHSKLDTSIGDNITNVSVIRKKTNTEKLKNQFIYLGYSISRTKIHRC